MNDSHTQRTIRGVNWNFLRIILQTVMILLATAILARLLPPADFGLAALATVFIGLAEMIATLGLGPALIQHEELDRAHLQAALGLSLIMGAILVIAFTLFATPLAKLFDQPELAPIITVLSLSLLGICASIVSRSLLMRDLNFKQLFFIDTFAYVLGYVVVGISLATMGHGVWSLVYAALTTQTTAAVGCIVLKPVGRPRLLKKELGELTHFGTGISLNSIVNYAAVNTDNLLIGKYLSANELGLYSRAFQLVMLPISRIATTLSTVLFPAYSRIQNDNLKLRRAYRRAISTTSLLAFPVLGSIMVAPETVIVGIFGDAWLAAAPILRLLAIAGIFKSIFNLSGSVIQAKGKVYIELRLQIIYLVIQVVGIYAVLESGLEAVAMVIILASLWLYLAKTVVVMRLLDDRWKHFFACQGGGVVLALWVAAFVGAADMATSDLDQTLSLVLLMCTGLVSYIIGFLFIPDRWLGDTPAWLIRNNLHLLPSPFRRSVARRFKIEEVS